MKKLLLLLVLATNVATAQVSDTLTGFLGVPFGASRQQVKAYILKNGATISEESTDAVYVKNISQVITSQTVSIAMYRFTSNDKMFSGSMLVEPPNTPSAIDVYESIVSKISLKYGEGEEIVDAKYPFSEADKNKVSAITGGYVSVATRWDINDINPENKIKNKIVVRITKTPSIFVMMQNEQLFEMHMKEKEEKDKNSY